MASHDQMTELLSRLNGPRKRRIHCLVPVDLDSFSQVSAPYTSHQPFKGLEAIRLRLELITESLRFPL